MLQTGTFKSREDRDRIRIIRHNGISLAVLAYTYGTNGIPIPKNDDWLVNLIDLDVIAADIRAARALAVDFVAVMLHFGAEYQRRPNKQQREIVDRLFDLGVDLILGSHPHVVQPVEVRRQCNRSRVVAYSLGNFVANQMKRYTYLGMILKVELRKDKSGLATIGSVETIPTRVYRVVENKRRIYRIFPIADTLAREKELNLPAWMATQLASDLTEMETHVKSLPAKPLGAGTMLSRVSRPDNGRIVPGASLQNP